MTLPPSHLTFRVPLPLNRPALNLYASAEGAEIETNGNADLACHLIPAMAQRLPLLLDRTPDPELMAGLPRIMNRLAMWFPKLAPIEVELPADPSPPPLQPGAGRGTGLFFTGGVDSMYTLLTRMKDIHALVFVTGFDIRPDQTDLLKATLDMAHEAAGRYNKHLIVVETNIRDYLETHLGWGKCHGAALAAVAHMLRPSLNRLMISASHTPDQLIPWGTHPELDPLWSGRDMAITHEGLDIPRLDKVRRIADDPWALDHLRICWSSDRAYNCGTCPKCIRTLLALDVTGRKGACRSLPGGVTPEAVTGLIPSLPPHSTERLHFNELREAYANAGRSDDPLARAIQQVCRHFHEPESEQSPPPLHVGPARINMEDGRITLTASVRFDGAEQELRVTLPGTERPPRPGDALLLWFLIHAMRKGCALHIHDDVSGDLLEHVKQGQRICTNLPVYEGLSVVPLHADRILDPIHPPSKAMPFTVAFGSGVDGFWSALQRRSIADSLLFIHGIDQSFPDPEYKARYSGWLQEAAGRLNMNLIEAECNLRHVLVDVLGGRWDDTYAMAANGMIHLMQPRSAGLILGGDQTYLEMQQCRVASKYHPLLDPCFSSAAVRIMTDGMDTYRHEKAAWLAREHPWVLPHIQVCTARLTGSFRGGRNCGICEKCLRTMTAFRLAGFEEEAQAAFDEPYSLERVAGTTIPLSTVHEIRVLYWFHMIQVLQARNADPELQQAIASLLVRSEPAWPKGPEPSLTDPFPRWTTSPAWKDYLAQHAESVLDKTLSGIPAGRIRDLTLRRYPGVANALLPHAIDARLRAGLRHMLQRKAGAG